MCPCMSQAEGAGFAAGKTVIAVLRDAIVEIAQLCDSLRCRVNHSGVEGGDFYSRIE